MTKERLQDLSRGFGIPLSVVIGGLLIMASAIFGAQRYVDAKIDERMEAVTRQMAEWDKRQQWLMDNVIQIKEMLAEIKGVQKEQYRSRSGAYAK